MLDSSGVETVVGSSSGAGEKNYITNPSMKSAATGWNNVGDLDVARTTTASELPREYSTAAGIKISADSNTQSVADYVYFDFTLDDVDLSKKLKIEWSQKLLGAYTAGQLAVVITTQADRTTALHTPVTTAIPAADGVFTTSFDSSTTATLSLVIRATTDMTTDTGIVISDVVVGPGIITQGAAVSEWQSYPPTFVGLGTVASVAFKYRRVGSMMEILGSWTNGTPTGVSVSMTLPSGSTLDTTIIGTSLYNRLGEWGRANAGASNPKLGTIIANTTTSTTLLYFGLGDYTPAFSPLVPQAGSTLVAGSEAMVLRASVPIAEWAGNGTVNLGAGAQVEYSFNSSTSTSSDTTSFGYGPAGALIQNFAPGGTGVVTKAVQWQYPIQTDDLIILEVDQGSSGARWVPASSAAGFAFHTNDAATTFYGAATSNTSSTVTWINFYSAPYATAAWSGVNTWRWRVRKAKASSPVGFGLAGTDGSSGLYKPGQAPGLVTGATIASGYVGENFTAVVSSAVGLTASLTYAEISSSTRLTLTAGVWLIVTTGYGYMTQSGLSTTGGITGDYQIWNATDGVELTSGDEAFLQYGATATNPFISNQDAAVNLKAVLNITATKVIHLRARYLLLTGSVTTVTVGLRPKAGLIAVRIA